MIPIRRLASSSALRVADVLIQALATLWITPLLITALGKERYGLWVTVITLVSYLDIFDLGLTSATSRYVSRALGRNDLDGARAAARSAFAILLAIGGGCLLLVAILAWAAPSIVTGESADIPLRTLVVILGTTAALSFPMRVFSGVLEAFVRYEFTTGASIIRTVCSTIALWWVINHGANLVHVVIVVAGSGLLQRGLNFIFARRVLPGMRLLSFRVDAGSRTDLLGYGAKNFMLKLVDLVRFRIDNVVIAQCVNTTAVSLYAPGMSLIRYFREGIDCLGSVLMPAFSRTEGAGAHDRLGSQLLRATRICAVVATVLGGSLALYGGYFIERWLGHGFRDSYLVALILVGPFVVALAQNPGVYLLLGLSKQERLLRLNIIEGVGNFVLSIALVFPFGIFGVALGTAIAMVLSKILLQPAILCDATGLSRRKYYLDALLAPIAITALPMLLCFAVLRPWLAPEYGRIFVAGFFQLLLVAPVIWRFVFHDSERESLSGILFRRPIT